MSTTPARVRDRRRAAPAAALVAALVALVAALGLAAPAQASAAASAASPTSVAAKPAAPAYTLGADGTTKATYSYADAVHESVWVDAPDLDGDGTPEKVAADIIRPKVAAGTKVPVIMDASPYYSCCGRGNENELKSYDADGTIAKMPLFYDNYFVPRGYAVVEVDMAGTNRSTGCVDEGGPSDILSVKAVIDWLNGRATAHTLDGTAATADWTTGQVGMIGKSYDGTLANGVAATGVKGLKTIVPLSGISSWYDYDRAQGIPYYDGYAPWLSSYVEGDRDPAFSKDCTAVNDRLGTDADDATGDYNAFWAERNYRDGSLFSAKKVKADVFIVHGLQDTNVKTLNFSRWEEALLANHVKVKMWLSRLGHVDPFDYDRATWVSTLHRWFDHELYGIDNGIDTEPAVRVEVSPNHWVTERSWPHSTAVRLHPQADGTLARKPATGAATFTNDPAGAFLFGVAAGDNPNRLLYTTGALTKNVRIAGTPTVTVKVSDDAPVGQLSVGLVDYGTAERVSGGNDGAETLDTESCYGESTDVDDACYYDVQRLLETSDYQILDQGWAKVPGPGTHTLSIDLAADDVVIPAGHTIGLIIMGVDAWNTDVWDTDATPYAVDLKATTLSLPVVTAGGPRFGKKKALPHDLATPRGARHGKRTPS
ncbi:CocE/NonD family hydrolase [Nocardioides sp. KR10-350]|uniref:CocE/NonD family hydrolase n=1 Tax=Nocardioides cheoyonin TaxID=3156615 RepID=UPI0032B5AECC